jgi:hypothetical protein
VQLAVAIPLILGAGAVAALALALVRRRQAEPLLADPTRGTPMIQVTGTLLAVMLAFVILAAFQSYNAAKTGAQSEATAVLDMTRTAALFPRSQRDKLRADFVCYGRAVVHQEWPAMAKGHPSRLVDYWVEAYRAVFPRLNLRSPRQQLGFQELLDQAATRTAGRLERLSQASPAVPTPLWLALLFGGCMSVALQLGMADPRERLRVQGLLVAVVASVVAAGLSIVYFLDHPYGGHTGSIEPSAMEQSLVLMRNLEPKVRLGCSQSGRPD